MTSLAKPIRAWRTGKVAEASSFGSKAPEQPKQDASATAAPMNTMSEDAKAIMLLCGRFGDRDEQEPLEQREYNKVVQWLVSKNLRPADLLDGSNVTALAAGTGLPEARLTALTSRGVQMGFAVESWSQSGIWVICRSDPSYPARYKTHLKDKAPPILFCAGDQALLKGGGLAMVGSRNVDQEGEEFSRQVAS